MLSLPPPRLTTPWQEFRRTVVHETKYWQWDQMLFVVLWVSLFALLDTYLK